MRKRIACIMGILAIVVSVGYAGVWPTDKNYTARGKIAEVSVDKKQITLRDVTVYRCTGEGGARNPLGVALTSVKRLTIVGAVDDGYYGADYKRYADNPNTPENWDGSGGYTRLAWLVPGREIWVFAKDWQEGAEEFEGEDIYTISYHDQEMELEGTIKSIDTAHKTFVLTVKRLTWGLEPAANLDTPRDKTVQIAGPGLVRISLSDTVVYGPLSILHTGDSVSLGALKSGQGEPAVTDIVKLAGKSYKGTVETATASRIAVRLEAKTVTISPELECPVYEMADRPDPPQRGLDYLKAGQSVQLFAPEDETAPRLICIIRSNN